MRLFDAAPLIALVAAEPGESAVAALIAEGEAFIPAPNLAEVIDSLSRRQRLSESRLRAVLNPLLELSLTVLETDAEQAWRAGLLRARHYHRSRRPLSVLDCMLLACAGPSDTIVTSDRPLLAAASAEGIAVEPVPDSRGEQPQPEGAQPGR